MTAISHDALRAFVNEHIDSFHTSRLATLENTRLDDLLKRKNPYLFKAKSLNTAGELVEDLLTSVLYASEEKFMGDFLEKLAIFVVHELWNGQKSSTTGIDLEFNKNDIRYLVSVKSGPNWGNSTSNTKQREYFRTAVAVIRQQSPNERIEPVLGICYSKKRTSYANGITTIHGQAFWELLTDDPNFYTAIVEPIGYRSADHNDAFMLAKARILNLFAAKFMEQYCSDGVINWEKLVAFNSGNLGRYSM